MNSVQDRASETESSARKDVRVFHRVASGILGIAAGLAGAGIAVYASVDLSWSGLAGADTKLGIKILDMLPGLGFMAIALAGFLMAFRFVRFAIKGKS